MNDCYRGALDTGRDHEWTAKLSRLRFLAPAQSGGPGGEEKVLDNLAELARRRCGPVCRAAGKLGGFWETALISAIFLLLAWDVLRTIRLLLG